MAIGLQSLTWAADQEFSKMCRIWKELEDALQSELQRRSKIRLANFNMLIRPYQEDMKVAKQLIKQHWAHTPLPKRQAVMSGKEVRLDHLGFRMCTITWGRSSVALDYEAIWDGALLVCDKVPPAVQEERPGPPTASVQAAGHDTGSSATTLEPARNLSSYSGPLRTMHLASRGGVEDKNKPRQEQLQDEVF
ncbi:hypothetical protein EIP91_009793 [Steccherinum ochraceum]|uniref:Uncharacterized protein n=1 Tax=Steccherinum ochraceum TaxID=92696 RepID=A0A4R0RJH0_9APHY|nr:hypothetical protein EIP91_009793 [Steccherinum ochraceum]